MRRIVTGLAIVTALILTTGTAMAHEHWGHYGYYYPGYRPAVVVAPAPVYVAPAPAYVAAYPVAPAPVVVAPAPAVVTPAPYYAPGLHSSFYVGGRRFGVGVGF